MSSHGYVLPLHISIKRSRQLTISLFIIHCLALLVVVNLNLAVIAKLALIAAIVASAYFYLYRSKFCAVRQPISLIFKDKTKVLISLSGTDYQQVLLCNDTLVHPWLVILNLKLIEGGRLSIPLLRDSMLPDQHRQLRVYLSIQSYQIGAASKNSI